MRAGGENVYIYIKRRRRIGVTLKYARAWKKKKMREKGTLGIKVCHVFSFDNKKKPKQTAKMSPSTQRFWSEIFQFTIDDDDDGGGENFCPKAFPGRGRLFAYRQPESSLLLLTIRRLLVKRDAEEKNGPLLLCVFCSVHCWGPPSNVPETSVFYLFLFLLFFPNRNVVAVAAAAAQFEYEGILLHLYYD